jgi:hypothetical protein
MAFRGLAIVLLLGILGGGPSLALAQGSQILRVATDTNLPWLDPHMGTAFTLRELSSHVFEGLVTIGEDYGIIPQLAESRTVSADGLGYTILGEAALSFVGLGAVPPTPSLGNILADARVFLREAPWMILLPSATLTVTVLGLNLLGDGIRDVLDPRMKI